VEEKFKINLKITAKIPFEIEKIGVNMEPIEAEVRGLLYKFSELNDGYYRLELSEPILGNTGENEIATLKLKGPKMNFKTKLYVIFEGYGVYENNYYPFKKVRGPIEVYRSNPLVYLGKIAMAFMDTFIDPNFSKTLKKIQEESKPKYL
jgi:hypothetical protein